MNVIVDFCLVPLGTDLSLSPYIAACQEVLQQTGLEYQLHAYGTNIEGDWDQVMSAIRECHKTVHRMGAPRITSTIKLGTRIDRSQSMSEKVASVQSKL